MKAIYDVIGKIPGAQFPDEWIIRGNHHDAWVNGAQDPLSGQISLLEEARALGELMKTGWRPKRTIVYAAWDGEEPGLLGSTEWVEEHAQELDQKAEVYINSDVVARGFLAVGGSHTLEKFINEVTRGIDDPEKHISIWKRSQLQSIAEPSSPEDRDRGSRAAGPANQRAGLRLRLQPVLTASQESLRSISDFAARRTAESITPFTMIFIGSPISRIPTSSTAMRWRKPLAAR